MASRLAPCPSCSRHVKVGPPSCPFCGGDVPTDVAPRVSTAGPGKGLTRAALMFAGATAVTACGTSTTSPTPPADAQADTGQAHASYGAIVNPEDAGTGDDASEAGQGMASYGVFIDAETAIEAGKEPSADAADDSTAS
jgi:hypothetical protein